MAEEPESEPEAEAEPSPARRAALTRDMQKAAHRGDRAEVTRLAEEWAGVVNNADQFGRLPLHEAARQDHAVSIVALLQFGAQVDIERPTDGWTPLMSAASAGAVEALSVLLESEADWRKENPDGETALDRARAEDQQAAEQLLADWALEHGTDDEQVAANTAAMIIAANDGDAAEVGRLLEEGADVNGVDEFGRLALNEAARHDHVAVVEALLEGGAELNKPRPSDGWTPLISASAHGATQALEALLEAGADWRLANAEGETALDLARWPWRTPLGFQRWQAEAGSVEVLEKHEQEQAEEQGDLASSPAPSRGKVDEDDDWPPKTPGPSREEVLKQAGFNLQSEWVAVVAMGGKVFYTRRVADTAVTLTTDTEEDGLGIVTELTGWKAVERRTRRLEQRLEVPEEGVCDVLVREWAERPAEDDYGVALPAEPDVE